MLDSTVVNVAVHSLSVNLHSDLGTVQWVLTGYLLALAAVIPVTGWAARRVGDKTLYLSTLALFTVGSVLCASAHTVGQLTAFRIVQGLGGGMLLPAGQIMLTKLAGPQNMPRVMAIVGVPAVLTPVLGPTIGGLLLDGPGWRWIFLINVPICAISLILGLRLLPADTRADAGRFDYLGLVLASTGLVALTYGLTQIGTRDSGSRTVWILVAGGALMALFVIRALRIDYPLLDMRLYRNPVFGAASLAIFCLGGAMYGAMILMPLYFQTVRGESAFATGLLLIPGGVGAAAAMWMGGRFTERWGGGVVATVGAVVAIVTTLPFVAMTDRSSYAYLLIAMGVRGLAVGLSIMPAMSAAYQALRNDEINDATPQLNVLQRVGGSIGTAIVAVALQHQLTHGGHSTHAVAAGFGVTFWWVVGISVVAAAAAIGLAAVERIARRHEHRDTERDSSPRPKDGDQALPSTATPVSDHMAQQ
ncbi:MDR family MFS transporter [Nocardia tengchongensis]